MTILITNYPLRVEIMDDLLKLITRPPMGVSITLASVNLLDQPANSLRFYSLKGCAGAGLISPIILYLEFSSLLNAVLARLD